MLETLGDILSPMSESEQIAYLSAELAAVNKTNEALEQKMTVVTREADAYEKQATELARDITVLKRENEHLLAEFNRLIEQIKIANARTFGARSEKIHPHQISLFNDMEASAGDTLCEPTTEKVLPKIRKKKTHIDYSKFETVVYEHILEEAGRTCDECGATLEEMGVEVKRVIKLVPAKLIVEEHRRHVYVCRPCSEANAKDGSSPVTITKASMPNMPLEKSCASPSLLAHIIHQKYSLALPIYRISEDMKNSNGLTLSRQTLGGWVIRAHERWLSLIYALMKEKLLEHDILNLDETGVQVLKEPKRKPTAKSYMWLFAHEDKRAPIYVFEYHDTRGARVLTDFLKGWSGAIVADGYAAYDNLGSGIVRVSCLVHIRRYFADIVKGVGKDKLENLPNAASLKALEAIDEMFHIDNTFNEMDAETRKAARLEKLKPKMDAFYSWCVERRREAVPSMALHDALSYAIAQWPKLENALTDGRLPLENNFAERAIRPFAIGRKNWLFSDTPRGAHASAAIYSIVTTAKGCGLKPKEYLEWLFETMPNTENLGDKAVLARFLPWSDEVPKSCQIDPAEAASKTDPLDVPLVDIDPDIVDVDVDCQPTVS